MVFPSSGIPSSPHTLTTIDQKEASVPDLSPTNLNAASAEVFAWAVSKGWHAPANSFGEEICMVHAELSEAVEEFRVGRPPSEIYYKDGKPEGVPIELADVIIQLLDMAGHHGIDLDEAIQIKREYNMTRSHRHGGKAL